MGTKFVVATLVATMDTEVIFATIGIVIIVGAHTYNNVNRGHYLLQ
jgi:hypothetical protein